MAKLAEDLENNSTTRRFDKILSDRIVLCLKRGPSVKLDKYWGDQKCAKFLGRLLVSK